MDLSAFSEVLEHDLRYLASEVRKTDTLAQQISGLFTHAEATNIKADTERSILRLRSLVKENKGIDSLRRQQDIWKPFLLACELKNPKLLCAALSSIQKLLAHGAVTLEGCRSIITALQQTEKANDDGVKLKMLQTILTMLQNQEFSIFEEGVCAVVSICFRIHSGSKNNPAVASTASATVRQAVALVLDHAVVTAPQLWTLPSGAAGGATNSAAPMASSPTRMGAPAQTAALKLLSDLCSMCAGKAPNWLTCSTLPRVFILDLMEFALLHRDKPFHQSVAFKTLLEDRVCPLVKQLLNAVVECDLDALEPAALYEGRLVLRCATAIVRKHSALAPMQALALLDCISSHCGPKHHPWQRVLCSQALRQLCLEPKLMYQLFLLYDMKMDYDANVVHNTIKVLLNLLNVFLKLVADNLEENLLGMLGGLHAQKACGKDVLQDLDNTANLNPGADVMVAYMALDALLAVVSGIEALTDMAVETGPEDSPGMANTAIVKPSVCATLLDTIWRDVLAALSNMLAKCQTEAIILALLRGYQGVVYSASLLNLVTARDSFLASLCDFSLGNPEESSGRQDEQARKATSGPQDSQRVTRSRTITSPRRRDEDDSAPLLPQGLTTAKSTKALATPLPALPDNRETVVLSTKNVQTLRTVFNMAHRLADVLGPSWIYVMNVLYGLDCLVVSLRTPDATLDTSSLPSKAPSELYILSTAAKQLFVHSANMSGDAVASMLSALSKISAKALPTQTSVTQPRLLALDRMVDIVLYNRYRIQETWPILLAHVMDVLSTDNTQVRTAAIEALDRTITGCLGPPRNPTSSDPPSSPRQAPAPPPPPSSTIAEDESTAVQHMLLVALESLYNEDKEMDSRCGILRTVLHILQQHGEGLTRGWAPLLRLLESVPAWEEPEPITQAFPSVELVCSDYLTTMPKEFIARALDVLALFAGQKLLLNISLTAIVLLWNACDQLGKAVQRPVSANSMLRMRVSASMDGAPWTGLTRQNDLAGGPTSSGTASASLPSSPMAAAATFLSHTSSAGALSWFAGGGRPPPPPSGSGGAGNQEAVLPAGPGPDPGLSRGSAFRADLSEVECTELLMHLFGAFRNLSMDRRPEVRNSGVRTMFLAVGSHSSKLSDEQWSTCLWDLLWTHLKYTQYMSETSSCQEAAGEELGKERGRAVMMIVHHSRNTEQKQWDETLILTLNGLTKMLRTYLPSVSRLPGFKQGWEELMEINGEVLRTGRKGIAMAAIGLVSCILQAHPTLIKKWMAKSIFTCLEKGVGVMAVPETRTQLQARVELVNCVGTLYSSLKEGLDTADMRQILRWLNMFARYPLAQDEHASHPAILPQIQKSVYSIIHGMLPIRQMPIWPDVVLLLCGFLCPLQLIARQPPTPSVFAPTTAPPMPSHLNPPPSEFSLPAPLPRTSSASSLASTSTTGSSRRLGSFSHPTAADNSYVATATAATPNSATATTPHAATAATPRSASGIISGLWGNSTAVSVAADEGLVAMFKPAYWDLAEMKRSIGPSWMLKISDLLVTCYRDHAPWQVRASTFAPVVSSLSECMALRHIPPHDERLWHRAALAFIDVVSAGIPALNIAVVNDGTFVDDAWIALATAFEQFFLAENLQAYIPPTHASNQNTAAPLVTSPFATPWDSDIDSPTATPNHPTSSSHSGSISTSLSRGLSSALPPKDKPSASPSSLTEITTRVLDCLTDSVLAACQFVPEDVRVRYLRVLDLGAAETREGELDLPASARLSHMCLRKLYVLCSRGSDSPGAALCQLEVAQRALPALLHRCKCILEAYVEDEKRLSLNESMPLWRVDEVVSVLDVLSVMTVAPSVIDAAAAHQPLVLGWLRLLRARSQDVPPLVALERSPRGMSESRRERTHVLFMYQTLVECVVCQDKGIRDRLQGLLAMVGRELALVPSTSATPLGSM